MSASASRNSRACQSSCTTTLRKQLNSPRGFEMPAAVDAASLPVACSCMTLASDTAGERAARDSLLSPFEASPLALRSRVKGSSAPLLPSKVHNQPEPFYLLDQLVGIALQAAAHEVDDMLDDDSYLVVRQRRHGHRGRVGRAALLRGSCDVHPLTREWIDRAAAAVGRVPAQTLQIDDEPEALHLLDDLVGLWPLVSTHKTHDVIDDHLDLVVRESRHRHGAVA
eukprot:scaffold33407_cov112-Isochrysis_galbana.AAC.6